MMTASVHTVEESIGPGLVSFIIHPPRYSADCGLVDAEVVGDLCEYRHRFLTHR